MTPNLVPRRYRGVSVAEVDVPLTEEALRRLFVGREAYRRTEYVVARRAGETAVVRVTKAGAEGLFLPIVEAELVAGPGECASVHAPGADTGIPSHLARAARELAPDARCVVVRGLYEHVSFICDPALVEVRVVEVAPPRPPKLLDQARRVVDAAEDLPPVELVADVTDLEALAALLPSDHYLYPCRGSGAAPEGSRVSYLDERPPRREWTLVGCDRSREIHGWFYGSEPPTVDFCPRRRAAARAGLPTLTKCCLLESGVERDGLTVTVPWGASLDEVREGLRVLLAAAVPEWAPA